MSWKHLKGYYVYTYYEGETPYYVGMGMNNRVVHKHLYVTVPLFENIIQDLFPGVEKPNVENINLKNQMIESCKALNK
jgi:hypothetical protein